MAFIPDEPIAWHANFAPTSPLGVAASIDSFWSDDVEEVIDWARLRSEFVLVTVMLPDGPGEVGGRYWAGTGTTPNLLVSEHLAVFDIDRFRSLKGSGIAKTFESSAPRVQAAIGQIDEIARYGDIRDASIFSNQGKVSMDTIPCIRWRFTVEDDVRDELLKSLISDFKGNNIWTLTANQGSLWLIPLERSQLVDRYGECRDARVFKGSEFESLARSAEEDLANLAQVLIDLST